MATGDKVSFNPIAKLFGNNNFNFIDNYFTTKPNNVGKNTHSQYSSDWEKWMAAQSYNQGASVK